MPGFDSLADTIAGSYTPASSTQTTEDSVSGAGSTQLQQTLSQNRDGTVVTSGSSGEGLARPGTTSATGTSATTGTATESQGTLPFGFKSPEEAATGVPSGFTDPVANNPALSCCQQCSIAAQQENIAKETVCSTMKTRVEAWFLENGCPIQIISLPTQQPTQPSPCDMMMSQQMQPYYPQQQFMVPPSMPCYACDMQQQQMQPYGTSCSSGTCSSGTCGM